MINFREFGTRYELNNKKEVIYFNVSPFDFYPVVKDKNGNLYKVKEDNYLYEYYTNKQTNLKIIKEIK